MRGLDADGFRQPLCKEAARLEGRPVPHRCRTVRTVTQPSGPAMPPYRPKTWTPWLKLLQRNLEFDRIPPCPG